MSLTVLAATADDFRTAEYREMGSLDFIRAAEAYAKGYSGQGITLGIFDMPIRQTHIDFAGKTILSCYTYDDSLDWNDDKTSHGSYVAGIMAANKDDQQMHGVAYHANLFTADFFYGDATPTFIYLNKCPAVKVVNVSAGTGAILENQDLAPYHTTAALGTVYMNYDGSLYPVSAKTQAALNERSSLFATASQNDKLFVVSTGNNGYLSPDILASWEFSNSDGKYNYLEVINCSSNPKVSFNGPYITSQRAMFAEELSLTAPGVLINSTNASSPDGSVIMTSIGTSAAAPHVAGTLGLVQEAYPYLTAKQLADVALSTTSPFKVDTAIPDMSILYNKNNVNVGINLYYYNGTPRPATQAEWKSTLLVAINRPVEHFLEYLKRWGVYDETTDQILTEKINFYNNVPLTITFGQGLLNTDKATNGLGSLSAKRLSASALDTTYAAGGWQALYKVNTASYNGVWSNNITETRVLMPGTGTDEDAELAKRQAFYRQYAAEVTNSSYHAVDPLMANKVSEVETYIATYNAELAANPLLGLPVGLYKEGNGILRLTGANTYQGSTIVAGGTLAVDGSVAGDAYSTNGGTLGGTGVVAGNVYNRGVLQPGTYAVTTVYDTNPAYTRGNLTIKGNLNSTGTLQIAVNGTDNSKLAVGGTSTLTGSPLGVVEGHGPLLNRSYTYLTSLGGIIGNASTSAVSPYVSLSSTIDGLNAHLTATQTATLGSLSGMSPSENSVGAALNQRILNASANDPNGNTTAMMNGLLYQDEPTSHAVLKQVTNENQAALVTVSPLTAMTTAAAYDRLDTALYDGNVTVTVPAISFDGVPPALQVSLPMPLDTANNLWFKLFRGYESYGATTNGGCNLSNKSFGGVIGYDKAINTTTRAGCLFSYAKTDYSTNVLDGKSHDWRVGVYASHDDGTWKTQGLMSYGHNRYDFNRYIPYYGDKLYSDYTAKVYDMSVKVKYLPPTNRAKSWQVGPYISLTYTHSSQSAYAEQGSSPFAQSLDSTMNNSLRAEAGVEWKHTLTKDSSFGGNLGYKRVLSGVNPELNGTFVGDTNHFTLSTDNDKAYQTYSLNLKKNTGNNWTVQGELRGEKSKNNHSETYSIIAKYAF